MSNILRLPLRSFIQWPFNASLQGPPTPPHISWSQWFSDTVEEESVTSSVFTIHASRAGATWMTLSGLIASPVHSGSGFCKLKADEKHPESALSRSKEPCSLSFHLLGAYLGDILLSHFSCCFRRFPFCNYSLLSRLTWLQHWAFQCSFLFQTAHFPPHVLLLFAVNLHTSYQ